MPARSSSRVFSLVFVLAACGAPAQPIATQSSAPSSERPSVAQASVAPSTPALATSAPATASGDTPSGAPTRTPASPTPGATPFAGPAVNPDGSVWVYRGLGSGFVVAGDDAIWAIYQDGTASRAVVRIDPSTNELETVIADLPVLPSPITAVGVNGSVWVASWDRSSVTRYDAETGQELAETPVGKNPVEPVFAYGDVWTTEIHGNSITRIDTETGNPQTIRMVPPGSPITMQAIRDDLAIVGNPGGLPYLVNPDEMAVVGQIDFHPPVGCDARHAAVDGDLWVDRCEDTLAIFDPDSGDESGAVTSPVTADPPFIADGVMWMPLAADRAAAHDVGIEHGWLGLDPDTHEVVAEYQPASRLTDGYYATAFDAIWMFGNEGILRIPADTLRAAQ